MSRKSHRLRVWLMAPGAMVMAAGQASAVVQETGGVAGAWAVGERPVVVFGGLNGEIGGEFADIVDVALGRDGSIVVADQGHGRISIHSAQGDVITYFGGIGEGPREFALVTRVVVGSQGRLFVFDEMRQRLSEWTLDGRLVGGKRVGYGGTGRAFSDVDQFASGAWYAREADRMLGAELDGVARDTVGFVGLEEGLVVGDRLTQVPGAMATHFVVEGIPMTRHALFSPRPLSVVIGECLVVGTSEIPSLEIVHRGGSKKGKLVLEIEVPPTGRESRRQWTRSTVASTGRIGGEREVRMIEGMGRRVRMARSIPFAHAMIVDGLGYIWTQDYSLPYS